MKTLLLPALTVALSFNAAAALNNSNVKFVGADETDTTQICVVAAQQGVESAVELAQTLGFGKAEAKLTICNGERLYNFARKFEEQVAPKQVAKKFVAANQNDASQICADAATHSLTYVEEKYGDVSDVFCNGRQIERFVKRFQL